MNSLAPSPVKNPVDAVHHERILVALSTPERQMFLPTLEWDKVTEFSVRTIDSTKPISAEAWLEILNEFKPTVLISAWTTPGLPLSWIESAQCSLRYVCHLVGSARYLVPRAFLERGGLLTNWGGLAGDAVAEHALLLALSSLRRQTSWLPLITQPNTEPGWPGTARLRTRTLRGRRVGIHGFGYVARALVKLLKAFDVEIASYSAGVPAALMRAQGVTPCESLNELAAHSEVFFECESLTSATFGCINETVLALMPTDAVFVNVGRGPIVDEPALLDAARAGRVHIALDVVVNDPIGPKSAFLQVPGAVLSPHVAGPTYDQFAACGEQALANLAHYLAGEPLTAVMTIEVYDRAT